MVEGTSGADHFEFYAAKPEENDHAIVLNGLSQTIDATMNTQVVFYGRGGADDVFLTGGSGVDKADLRETSAKLTGVSYQILIYSVRFTTVHSGGGQDKAYFYDTLGDDLYESSAIATVLSGAGYEHQAHNFHRAYAIASEGYDHAHFYDSEADDRFKATPADARMYGDEYYNFGRNFELVEGFSTAGGNDRAYLYDSLSDDVLEMKAVESSLIGATFENVVHGFPRVYAYASGGYDEVVFHDTVGDDYYKVDHHGARMYGDGYYNRALDFDNHTVFFSTAPDKDRVSLTDSSGSDGFVVSENQLLMSHNNVDHHIHNPISVFVQQTNGVDYYHIYSVHFNLEMEGDWIAV